MEERSFTAKRGGGADLLMAARLVRRLGSAYARPTVAAIAALFLSAGAAFAGPTYTFTTSVGTQPSDVGKITLTQITTNTVDVLVDLSDTTNPLPRYGFINTGGPHTPFAFTIAGSEAGVSASFITPVNGNYGFGIFSLSTGNGEATPYGTYGISINSTADNGSGNAYYGDLNFRLTRTSGLSTDDFITNALIDSGSKGPAYFAADLTDGKDNTGSQAWKVRDPAPPVGVPEPGSVAILGASLLAWGLARRRSGRN